MLVEQRLGVVGLVAGGMGLVVVVVVEVEMVVVVLEVEVVVMVVEVGVVVIGCYRCGVELRILTVNVVQQLHGSQQFGTVVVVHDAQVVEVGRFQFAEQLQVLVSGIE